MLCRKRSTRGLAGETPLGARNGGARSRSGLHARSHGSAKDRAAHPSDACVIVENIVENMVERMPLRVVAAILLAAGCAPVSAQPRGAPSPASAAPRSAVTAPVELRVSLDENTHYRRSREAFAGDVGGHALRFEVTSALELRPLGAGRFLCLEQVERLDYARDGEPASPPSGSHGASQITLRSIVDARNELVEGPDAQRGGRLLRASLLAAVEALRVHLPAHPVQGGDRWSAPRVTLAPEGLRGITVDVDLDFVLMDVANGEAQIGWEGRLEVRPFAALGGRIEGRGEVSGVSWLSLEDGVAGHTELDLMLAARPAGASEALELIRVGVKYAERTERVSGGGDEIPEGDPRRLW